MNQYFNKLIMYHEIQELNRNGFSNSRISEKLVINRRTVHRYLLMSEQEYEDFIELQTHRSRELAFYEDWIKAKLKLHQETSAAQMHDWLLEHFPDFPGVTARTVYNFVMWVRQKHHLPHTRPLREYNAVEELPYGLQAQVDFGQYNMRDGLDKRVKVWFFAMSLSRSRYKFIFFSDIPFTSHTAIEAHEKAFSFFNGIPDQIVYDQDKLFITDENGGDLLLTSAFKDYCRERKFHLHFCRKADPESKGKIENVVKYVKQNFLFNRPFTDVNQLNADALAWLGRTANAKPHAGTQKVPFSEWCIEQSTLTPFTAVFVNPPSILYTVRKDNIISWKGNFYTLPSGTYKGRGTQVTVSRINDLLQICSLSGAVLCSPAISSGKGKTIVNTDHKRDKSSKIQQMISDVSLLFEDTVLAKQYLDCIHREKPRYIRDQLIILRQTLNGTGKHLIIKTLQHCVDMQIYSANDFKSVADSYLKKQARKETCHIDPISSNPLSGTMLGIANYQPGKSSISDYDHLMRGAS